MNQEQAIDIYLKHNSGAAQTVKAIGLLKDGKPPKEVAREMDVHISRVYKIRDDYSLNC